jgi:hypothetical protein
VASIVLVLSLALPTVVSQEGGEDTGVDPFGPPEGPIPFPIINVSSSYDEDRFPSVFADEDSIRVVWNKGARDMFVYQVVQRAYDGKGLEEGEDWVSVLDPRDQDFTAHEHYSHEGSAVGFRGKIYFVFASDDPSYTNGTEHDIVLRSLDPATGDWGPFVEVTPYDEGQDRDPEVVVFGDRLVIAWRTNDPNKADGEDDDLVMRTYDGAAFSAIVPVSPPGDHGTDAALDMATTDDGVVMVWEYNNHTNSPSDWDVMYREWNGTGFTSPPVSVAPDVSRVSKLPKIAASGDTSFVVWESRPGVSQTGAVRIKGRALGGGASPVTLDVSPLSSSENVQPDVVAAGDLFYVLWSSFDDSLTHGPDSDIVVRSVDGEDMGDILEVSHPRDGDEVNEGFVSGVVFHDNLYAVWRMMYPVDPSLPLDVPVNEDIVLRRVTDYVVEVTARPATNPVVGDEVPIEVTVSSFYGEPVDHEGLDLHLRVLRDLEVLPGEVDLDRVGQGVLNATYVPEEKGTYTFVVTIGDREMGSEELNVYGPSSPDDDDGPDYYMLYTVGAICLLVLAVVVALSRRR